MEILLLVMGLVIGAGAAGLVSRSRAQLLASEVARLEAAVAHERERADEKAAYATEVEQRLSETIEAAASRAVKGNNEEFLSLAGERLKPIDERLRAFEEQLRDLERQREGAYSTLSQQVKGLMEAQDGLRGETGKLATALQKPGVRGRWGEATLRRMVDLAGMVEHCDFVEQATVEGSDGRIRPDLVVNMPGGGAVVVDSKAPLDAYLAALEHDDEQLRERKLDDHVKALRDHMLSLGRKSYWEQFETAPDFVVMFVPVESAVAAALGRRPELFEDALAKRVVLATPSSFFPMLRVVDMAWREERAAESAREIQALGVELHKRLATMAGHFAALGKKLDGAVGTYNKAVGSLERSVLPQARRFEEHGAGSGSEVEVMEPLGTQARELTAEELLDDDGRVRELTRGVALDDDDYGTLGGAAATGR